MAHRAKDAKGRALVRTSTDKWGRGKLSLYTPEIVDEMLWRMSEGENLVDICREDHMPARPTVWFWRERHPEFDARFVQARMLGADAIAADLMHISNEPIIGAEVTVNEVVGENGVITKSRSTKRSDAVRHRELQINTRKWLLSNWDLRYRLVQREAPDSEGGQEKQIKIEGGLPDGEP